MASAERVIQAMILFSTVLGVFFLWEVSALVPAFVFDFLAVGWVLFLIDSALTFIRPKTSYYLGVVLALLTLSATLGEPEHYSLVASGNLEATVTLILGSAAQVGIILSTAYFLMKRRGTGGV